MNRGWAIHFLCGLQDLSPSRSFLKIIKQLHVLSTYFFIRISDCLFYSTWFVFYLYQKGKLNLTCIDFFFVMIWTVHALSFLEPQDGERGSIKRQCMASASIHHLPKDFGSTFCIVIFWEKNVDIMINIITIYFLYKKTNMSFFIFFY